MEGCGGGGAKLFPKINNQPGEEADTDKKKPPPPTITNFKAPVAVAYLNSSGSVVLSRGTTRRIVAPAGAELALSHAGKKRLYTPSESKNRPENAIVPY